MTGRRVRKGHPQPELGVAKGATGQQPLTMFRTFRPYPAYRESGIDWLRQVPVHWKVGRLRSSVTGCQNGVWGDEPDGKRDVICVRVADFDRRTYRVKLADPTFRAIDAAVAQGRQLRQNDLLLEKSGGGERQPVGAVVMYDHPDAAVCSNFMARMPVAKGYSARFLVYLHAALYGIHVNRRSIKQSSGIQNLDSCSYLNEAAAFPEAREQEAISVFLDTEIAVIDALIMRKKELVELLQEKRAALTYKAVTKGLTASVEMKDSIAGWIGPIPTHWEVRPTKTAARLYSGHTPSRQHAEYWRDCVIPLFTLADIWRIRDNQAIFVSETSEAISEIGLANSSARLLPKGTVMVSRTASVGFSAIMGVDMATSQDFVNWACGPTIRPEYLLYVFRSMKEEFRRLTMGSTHQTIYITDVGRFSTPVPPIEEQDRIVAFVRERSRQIDLLIAKIDQAIDLLKERRSTLIAAAVTGKIDVREEAT
jgi:type I restriction enzyme S subunit